MQVFQIQGFIYIMAYMFYSKFLMGGIIDFEFE